MTTFGDEYVCRLDVAVNYAFGVSCIQCIGNLNGHREDRFQVHGAARDQVLERRSVQELHGDESLAINVTNVVYGADVGVVQCRCGFCLTLEPGQRLRIASQTFGQKLECDKAAEARVLCLIDHPHASTAQPLDYAVVRDGLANELGRGSQCREC